MHNIWQAGLWSMKCSVLNCVKNQVLEFSIRVLMYLTTLQTGSMQGWSMEGSTLDRALWVALAITAGVAAGTAAAVTASAFPYAFGAAFSALRSKRKKEHREHRSHRYKSDKTKRSSSKPKEDQAYRDAIRRSLLEWKDIDVSLESFPYFLKYIHILLALCDVISACLFSRLSFVIISYCKSLILPY